LSNFSTLSWENKLLFEWVSDCCLTPIELFFNFIMGEQVTFWVSEWLLINANWAIFQLYHGRTSYFLSEWWLFNANWAIFQLYQGRTSYFLSEWVSECCLTPIDLFFNFIMGEQVTFWVSEWLLFNANWAILSYFSTWSWENKLLFEWVSDCCLMPIELFINFIMGEQVTFWVSEWLLFNANWAIFQLYHGRTSYFLNEWAIVD
jgi:hypothetical protein